METGARVPKCCLLGALSLEWHDINLSSVHLYGFMMSSGGGGGGRGVKVLFLANFLLKYQDCFV